MTRRNSLKPLIVLHVTMTLCWASSASAQIFTDDFDDFNAMSRFSVPFMSTELEPPVFDGFVDYALDYGALPGFGGTLVPPAPRSAGETTVGIGIYVNVTDDGDVDEGESIGISPVISSLPSDYTVSVDAYIYYESGGGASEHAVLGVNADQTAVPYTFRPAGAGQFYHVPHDSGLEASFADDYYRVADGTITQLYGNNGDPIPDPSTTPLFPADGTDPVFNDPGYPGNQWMELTLTKGGNILNFYINGFLVDTYDASGGATSGDIVIAGADIFNSANATNLVIFDNLSVVEGVVPPVSTDNADFDGDGDVDGDDYLAWQRGFGINDGTALLADGDANGDHNVDDADLTVWQTQFGGGNSLTGVQSVPEPSAILLSVCAVSIGALRRKSRAQ